MCPKAYNILEQIHNSLVAPKFTTAKIVGLQCILQRFFYDFVPVIVNFNPLMPGGNKKVTHT